MRREKFEKRNFIVTGSGTIIGIEPNCESNSQLLPSVSFSFLLRDCSFLLPSSSAHVTIFRLVLQLLFFPGSLIISFLGSSLEDVAPPPRPPEPAVPELEEPVAPSYVPFLPGPTSSFAFYVIPSKYLFISWVTMRLIPPSPLLPILSHVS